MSLSPEFPVNPARKLPLPRIDIDSPEAVRMVARKQPFVARVDGWGIMGWNVEALKKALSHYVRKVTRKEDGAELDMSGAEVIDLVLADPGWKSRYHPSWGGGPLFTIVMEGETCTSPGLEALARDVERLPFFTDEFSCELMLRNSSRRELGYYYTECHWEPNALPGLNAQVVGKKHLWLFAPDQAAHLGVPSGLDEPPYMPLAGDGCHDPEKLDALARATCYEVIMEPGDIVYWPEFWFHWFVHYHEVQVNVRFDWVPESFELNSMSAAWLLANAVADVVGGFANIDHALATMSPETSQLLHRIERSLIDKPQLLHPRAMGRARMQGPQQAYDDKNYDEATKR